MDRLIEAIEDKQNPSVVGLDPTEALVPKQVVASFAEEIAEQVEDPTEAPAAQLSVAFFEFRLRPPSERCERGGARFRPVA